MPPLPPSPDRHPVTSPSRSSSSDSSYAPPPLDDRHHPHAASPSRTTSLTMPNDRLSLRSFVSTSESTAVSDHPTVTKSPGLEYAYTLAPQKSISYYHNPGKLAPPRRSRSGDHNVVTYDEPLHLPLPSSSSKPRSKSKPKKAKFTTTTQLAAALGPDNAPHTTEIASVPCAGVRIPHGPLTGLLAWRLVVRDPRPGPMARSTWGASWWGGRRRKTQAQARPGLAGVRAHSHSAGFMLHEDSERTTRGGHAPAQGYAYSYSELMPPSSIFKDVTDSAAVSTASLPMPIDALGSPPRVMPCDAVAANFILDTSLPYSLIARDTLRALGYTRVPSNGDDNFSHRRGGAQDADHDDSDGEEEDDEEDEDEEDDDKRKRRKEKERDAEVEVTIQGVQTKARVARAGEAGRLGVQFLRDAGVSVFFPREEGVGPVLYYESSRALHDIPLTIASLPPRSSSSSSSHQQRHSSSNGAWATAAGVERWKPMLPQRVRAFFGLVDAS